VTPPQAPAVQEHRTDILGAPPLGLKGAGTSRLPRSESPLTLRHAVVRELRDLLHDEKEQYVLEVPCEAKVRLARGSDWIRACDWAAGLPKRAWQTFTTRDGEKGPISVRAVKARVYTPRSRESKRPERPETLLVVRNDSQHKTWTYLAEDTRTHLRELVRVGPAATASSRPSTWGRARWGSTSTKFGPGLAGTIT